MCDKCEVLAFLSEGCVPPSLACARQRSSASYSETLRTTLYELIVTLLYKSGSRWEFDRINLAANRYVLPSLS